MIVIFYQIYQKYSFLDSIKRYPPSKNPGPRVVSNNEAKTGFKIIKDNFS